MRPWTTLPVSTGRYCDQMFCPALSSQTIGYNCLYKLVGGVFQQSFHFGSTSDEEFKGGVLDSCLHRLEQTYRVFSTNFLCAGASNVVANVRIGFKLQVYRGECWLDAQCWGLRRSFVIWQLQGLVQFVYWLALVIANVPGTFADIPGTERPRLYNENAFQIGRRRHKSSIWPIHSYARRFLELLKWTSWRWIILYYKGVLFLKACGSCLIPFLFLFCRAFLGPESSAGQWNIRSFYTQYEIKVVLEDSCLSTCHPEVLCDDSKVYETSHVGAIHVYSSAVR